jgi:NitT/TauT family transport system substrate-binding protein
VAKGHRDPDGGREVGPAPILALKGGRSLPSGRPHRFVTRWASVRARAGLVLAAVLLLAACSGGERRVPAATSPAPSQAPASNLTAEPSAASASEGPAITRVRLQLQWYPQAQSAGYFAAIEQGYYAAENLEVEWLPGGGAIAPQSVGSAPDGPEFTIAWQPKVLVARAADVSQLVNIAQVFQRSATLTLSWKDSKITTPADFAGKKVGLWGLGNELEVVAGLKKSGLEPGTDYTPVSQDFDMALLLTRQVDVAESMIYDGYAQILETTDPGSGQLFQPTDLDAINWNDEGSAMLQDAVFARSGWLAEPGNEDVAIRFLRASFEGWIYCRDNPADCVQYTLKAGASMGAGHQAWMLNEVNALIWPAPNGIGMLDQGAFRHTIETLLAAGMIAAEPGADATRTDLAAAALAGLTDADTKGASFVKSTIDLTPGGS